jgi:hypothetical protein
MGRLIVSTQMTLDGVIDVGSGTSRRASTIAQAATSSGGAAFLGRKTYEVLLPTGRH